MAWVLGDLTEEQGDKYRSEAMARGPPVPDMSALAQDHELDYLSVSPERYADMRFARAKTQFPLEDPYQPRGGRKEELNQIALGTMPAMPPPPDRIYYAPSASQVPASSHMPTVLQDLQGGQPQHQPQGGTAQTPQQPPQHNDEEAEQQQQTPDGGEEDPEPRQVPTAKAAAISYYPPKDQMPVAAAKAPPPRPPSSSEDEWPSEEEAPPEEEDAAMVQLSTSTCRGSPTTTTTTTSTPLNSPRGSRSRSPDRGAGPLRGPHKSR